MRVSSGQPRPQIAGADDQDEDADYPADHHLGGHDCNRAPM